MQTMDTLELEIELASRGLSVGALSPGALGVLHGDGSATVVYPLDPGEYQVDRYTPQGWARAQEDLDVEPSWSTSAPISAYWVAEIAARHARCAR